MLKTLLRRHLSEIAQVLGVLSCSGWQMGSCPHPQDGTDVVRVDIRLSVVTLMCGAYQSAI